MGELVVLPSALKHGLEAKQIEEAWGSFVAKRPRGDDVAVAIGFSGDVEIEMVGLLTADGKTLMIHAMSPATEKVARELGIGRR